MVVIFSGFAPKDYNLCVLLELFKQPATIIYLCTICFLIVMIFMGILVVETNQTLSMHSDSRIDQVEHGTEKIQSQEKPIKEHKFMNYFRESKWLIAIRSIQIVPKFKNPIPPNSLFVVIFLPFSYAALGVI